MFHGQAAKPALSYLDPAAHAAVVQAGAQVGDTIRLLKTKDGSYAATVLSDAVEPPAPQPAPPVRVAAPASQQEYNGNGKNGHTPAPVESHPLEDLLARCFIVAAHALGRAHSQLKSEGYTLEPPIWEDVRAAGISLFIERNRREAQR